MDVCSGYSKGKNVSWQLSIWFFYTVAYDLLLLIVAVIDGVYTSFSDISSYVVCLVTTYCVIVVDSYYEKVRLDDGRTVINLDDVRERLLQDERLEKAGGGSRRRSSLVINRSSPDSPTPQVEIPPTTYTLNPSSNTLAPPPISLGPPPSSRHGYHPAPSSPSKEPVQARHHHHHAYHNNV
ncbi:hypothetical protein Pcinc_027061 [Petrolisthes cinctipes]|uniref:Uncharacterized protein n=1 Tax=Petrolisthes cinctipes TaxID=88211 RepID=A0AAE1F5S0_PETCI|nr:hypothetical protein Pcinc_027061 [Petrolisthes cinctipes]